MPKRLPPTVYIGSLEKNIWKYIVRTDLYINQKDPFAVKFSK